MIARISTAIFYAIVFFLLGVWSAGRLPPLKSTVENGADWVITSVKSIGQQKPTKLAAAAGENELDSARAAFARGDLTAAIAAYSLVLKANPNDIDAQGELGNVYFNAGRLKDAASTFHAAALLMVTVGDPGRARLLEPAIRTGDPALADGLLALLAKPAATGGAGEKP